MNHQKAMEIPFIPETNSDLGPKELAEYLRKRLPHVAAIAAKLADHGSPIKLTIGGVAFEPKCTAGDLEGDEQEANKEVESLGILGEVRPMSSRSYSDLLKAEDELDDRVAYDDLDRKMRDLAEPICYCCEDDLLEKMSDLEEQYGRRSLVIPNDYERGILHGKLEAMRWMLGEEWDDREERAVGDRVEQLIETAKGVAMVRHIIEDDPEILDNDEHLDHDTDEDE